MQHSTIELQIARDIEEQARKIAQGDNCSFETVLEDGLALLFSTVPADEIRLDRLQAFSDEQLWAIVHLRLSFAQDRRVRLLMEYGREGKLIPHEANELETLLDLIDRQTLLRSQALFLLQERGHDTLQYLNVQLVTE